MIKGAKSFREILFLGGRWVVAVDEKLRRVISSFHMHVHCCNQRSGSALLLPDGQEMLITTHCLDETRYSGFNALTLS